MRRLIIQAQTAFCLAFVTMPLLSQELTSGIDPEAIIERILAVDNAQRAGLEDIVYEAEYIEGENSKDKGFVEKVRFEKKIYVKYLQDTTWYYEEYLGYHKDGEPQSQTDLEKEASKRLEKKRKRKSRDVSYPMLRPFHSEERGNYEIVYLGVAEEEIDTYVCHHFAVTSKEEDPDRLNGDFYFEAESFHLVRVDFSPAKLVKQIMFRLKEMNMSITYGPTPDGFWLPRQFDIQGRGKAALFFGVKFAGTEYFRNPIINSGLGEDIFEVDDGR